MSKIGRDSAAASREKYDIVIVGGGIYGAMLSLEASLKGLRSILIEKDDFGGATSFNSLRIIHGGFRYLQDLNFRRFFESIAERRWFFQKFPQLVFPLPCLMPLYGQGLRRSSLLRVALAVNKVLSSKRNSGVNSDRFLPGGRVIRPIETEHIFPAVDTEALQGGAIWYDGFVPDSQRIIIEVLKWAGDHGAVNLNYTKASDILKSNNAASGVRAKDRINGTAIEIKAGVVVNACGPWCREVAGRFDRDYQDLFKTMAVWNVLFDRNALSHHALAVTPKKKKGHTYFCVPFKGMLLAGTGHAPWPKDDKSPMPSEEQLQYFIDDLNLAIPGLELAQRDIMRVFPGLQPANKYGGVELAAKEIILNHADFGGPTGLYSISGVKFTTARRVAENTIEQIIIDNKFEISPEKKGSRASMPPKIRPGVYKLNGLPFRDDQEWNQAIRDIVLEEAVEHLDDLVLRRTAFWENPGKAIEIAPLLCDFFDWDLVRRRNEINSLTKLLR